MGAVWLNGKLVDPSEATLSCDERGLLYGDGLFDTLRLYGGKPFHFERHLERLSASADFLKIPLGYSSEALFDALTWVAEENDHRDGAARITLTRGSLPRGPRHTGSELSPTLLIQTRPLPDGLKKRREEGIIAATLPWPLRAEGLPLQSHKTLSYTASIVAMANAPEGTEPLLETTGGNLCEGATSNLFWVKGGALHTPSLESGCLPGIARGFVIELAREAEIEVREGLWPRAALLEADEAFITNSIAEVTPLVALDSHPLGTGAPGPVTLELQQRYARAVLEATWDKLL